MANEPTLTRIGRYEVIRKIATGGMAELFLARFVGPGGFEKRCALKRILPQFAADETFTRMFLNEARVTAMFDHPNLVQIFELGQDDDGQFFIAMELVNGLNLRQLFNMCIEKGRLIPPELAAFMVTQALDGLAYAHNFRDPDSGRPLNLVHRDISPQNILVSYEGAVKLVDFGIVKGNSISGETQAGMLKGKVAYMSPEQASGETIDSRSDLFSLGVCFYELVVGERPFSGANEIMTLKSILEEPPLPITSFIPDCPIGIERAIYRSLEKYPDDRFSSAREFQSVLQGILRECPTPLGRHVVAEFFNSMTEGTTDSNFDSTKLKIPRHGGAGFGHAINPGDSSVEIPSQPYVPATTRRTPSRDVQPYTPTPTADHASVSTMGADLQAPAFPVNRMSPGVIAVFFLSAIIGAFAVWYALQKRDQGVTATPVVMAKLPPQKVVEARPDASATPAKVAPPVTPPPKKVTETPPPRRGRSTGTVQLDSVPSGLTVYERRRRIGRTPLTKKLTPGVHTLTLKSKKFGIDKTVRVTVKKGEKTTVPTVRFGRATIRVVSRPDGSKVQINGADAGVTPLQRPVYEGKHEIRATNPRDGDVLIRKKTVKAGDHAVVTFKF